MKSILSLLLLAALPAEALAASTLQWQRTVNTQVTSGILTKSAGCDGCSDAGAFAPREIAANGSISMVVSETDANRFLGLTKKKSDFVKKLGKGGPTKAYDDLDYALYFVLGGYVEVRENGIHRTDTTYGTGDVFTIAAVGNVIHYKKNGETFYVSTVPPTFPLDVGALLLSTRSTLRPITVVEGQ